MQALALRRRPWLLSLGLALALAGCGVVPMAPRSTPTAPQEPERLPELATFRAELRGHKAVPRSNSPARGELIAVLDRKTGLLRWKLRFGELSSAVQGAGFHSPGMEGELAPMVLSLGRHVISPFEGRAMLTPAQRSNLLAGQWYVNLPTAHYPQGELRGQLLEQR